MLHRDMSTSCGYGVTNRPVAVVYEHHKVCRVAVTAGKYKSRLSSDHFITPLEKEQKSFLEMSLSTYSSILALLSMQVVLVQSYPAQISLPTCGLFQASFLAVIEETLDAQDAFFQADHDFTFFTEIMKFRDANIQHTINDAMTFFKESYGLDFSVSPPDENNQYFYENAVMFPFRLVNVDYLVTLSNWIETGNSRSNCYLIREGGFTVSFTGPQTLHGTYGGDSGKGVGEPDGLFYGYYNIDVCHQSPVIIQFQTASPVRPVPVDGISVINCDLYSRVLGYGKAQGVFSVRPSPELGLNKFHLSARNVFTFSEAYEDQTD